MVSQEQMIVTLILMNCNGNNSKIHLKINLIQTVDIFEECMLCNNVCSETQRFLRF